MTIPFRFGATCVISLLGFSAAIAGEFVTPEVRLAERSVPLCSSKLGCWLQGIRPPENGAAVITSNLPPVATGAQKSGSRHLSAAARPRPRPATDANDAQASGERLAFVRVLTKTDITSFRALAGRPVSLGPDGQDGQAAGRAVFKQFGIKIAETPLDVDNALDGLASGDISAVVITRPDDASRLKRIRSTTLHFLSVPSGSSAPLGMKVAALPDAEAPGISRAKAVITYAINAKLLRHLSRRELAANL